MLSWCLLLCITLSSGFLTDSDLLSHLHDYELISLPTRRNLRSKLVYRFTAFGFDLELPLELHRSLFSDDFVHHLLDPNGQVVDSIKEATDCIYKGPSRTVISFCGGIVRGKTLVNGTDLIHIQPMPSDPTTHVVYRHRDLKETAKDCGLDHVHTARKMATESNTANSRARDLTTVSYAVNGGRKMTTENRIVEIVLVNDYSRYQLLKSGVHGNSAYLMGVVDDIYSDFPSPLYAFDMRLMAMYTFVLGDPVEISHSVVNNGKSIEVSDLLGDFKAWGQAGGVLGNNKPTLMQTNIDNADVVHLLSALDFYASASSNDGVVGLAYVGDWCKATKYGVTQAGFTSTFSSSVANVIAHEIGHNMGMEHTNVISPKGSACFDSVTPYFMNPSTSTDPTWSACSVAWVEDQISNGKGDCTTFAETGSLQYSSGPTCGNGIVEKGEECDSGATDDSCCTSSCELAGSAKCSANDDCCDPNTCDVRASGYVCRQSAHPTCDTQQETCDGESAKCPVDLYAEIGVSCAQSGKPGSCFFGECISRVQQCSQHGSTSSNPFDASFDLACDQLRCKYTSDGASSFYAIPLNVAIVLDGTSCTGSDNICYQGSCKSSSSVVAISAQCSNGLKDGDETSVDCGGGSCPACAAGQTCVADTDCIYPSSCNSTICQDSGADGGRRNNGSSVLGDEAVAVWQWVQDNVVVASLIGALLGILILMFAYSCCCKSSRRSRQQNSSPAKRPLPVSQRAVSTRSGAPVAIAVPVKM